MFQFLREIVRPYLYDRPHIWGGESYIQLVTGINFAFFAWREWSYRKSHLADQAKEIRDSTLLTIRDSRLRSGLMDVMVGHCGWLGKCHDIIWTGCRYLSLLFALIGTAILYTGGTGRITWILILPLVVYLGCAYLATGAFWVLCKISTWFCNKMKPDIPGDAAQAKELLK